jgi:nucleoside phosphorylase
MINHEAIASFLNDMGQVEAANATRDLLEAWKPQHIILTGLAGALHPDIQLADIIFSDWIYYYEPSKITPEGVEIRPKMYPANAMLLNRMTAFVLNREAPVSLAESV